MRSRCSALSSPAQQPLTCDSFLCSPSDDASSAGESSQNNSEDEPVVLGAVRQRRDVKSIRYVTEPCILCQEQQEVRERMTLSGFFPLEADSLCLHNHVIGFCDLVNLWVIKIKKAYDPLRA